MNNSIVEYIRDSKGNKRGVLAALRQDGKVNWGFSLCNRKDAFDKKVGLALALARAQEDAPAPLWKVRVPAVCLKRKTQFKERAARYFKDCEVSF